ncbi:MAG: tyrosine-type recombinase/integrase [Acidobacteriota bacterium]|jgi:integrase
MARKGDGIYLRGSSWWLDAYINGRRYQMPLGKNIKRAAALEIATIKRGAILKGEAGIGRKKKDIPFEKAKEEFLRAAEASNRPNTLRGYRQHLAELAKTFGQAKLSEISPFLIEKHRQRRIAEGAPVGFNRELGTLKTMFNWCIDRGKYDGANPTRKVKRTKESRGPQRALELEEEARLLAACSEPLKTILLCGIDAGLRIPSETLWLKKADVDLAHKLVTVPAEAAKNGKAESVPLTARLHAALKRMIQSHPGSEYLFTKRDGQPFRSIQSIFRTAARKAGLLDISPHVCRHTFATRLDQSGASLRTIQELGRWADIRMVQRYDNVSERRKREAIAALNSPTEFPTTEKADLGLMLDKAEVIAK